MAKGNETTNIPGERQKFYFQFVTTPTADTPGTTLLLHFNNKRYFFGRIAEGTQRACIQRGVGIKKVRNIFLTGPTSWQNMGGLIGMILTMADIQTEELDPVTGKRPILRIQGGPKLMHSIACARRFVFRTGMPIEIHEASAHDDSDQPTYVDANINVWSIPVRRRGRSGVGSPKLSNGRSQSPETVAREQSLRADTVKNMFDSDWRKDRLVESRFDAVRLPALIWVRDPVTKELKNTQCATMADAPHLQPDSRVLVRNPWPASLVGELPKVDNIAGSVAISYVVRGKPQRGKFLPQKAKELGVKAGPDFTTLANGSSVTLADGTVVTPEMVLGKTEPGKGMAIFDLPNEDYLEELSRKLQDLVGSIMEGVEVVTWLLGHNVLSSPAFTQLTESLPGVQHLVSSPDACPNYLALDSAAASAIRLAQIRPECFKLPAHNNNVTPSQSPTQALLYTHAERGLMVEVAPKLNLNRTQIPSFVDVAAIKESNKDTLANLIPNSQLTDETIEGRHDTEIITLGTGSAVPSKYRNVSATLVRVPGNGSYLFDCGENTLGQLRRIYTATELLNILADLRMIWISHLHADHHLGTLSIVEAKNQAMQQLGRSEPKLYIISEPNMADYLNDFGSVQSSSHCELLGVFRSKLKKKSGPEYNSSVTIQQTALPISEFLTVSVNHCHGAQACSITFNNGFKFSYSGDCRPSAEFAQIGQNSDVLLHEATFDDGLEGDAKAKKHSTTVEALAVAYSMKAKNVILTHFSQRYQKIPVLSRVKFSDVILEEGQDGGEAGPIEDTTATQIAEGAVEQTADSTTSTEGSTTHSANAMETLQQVAQEMNVCVAFDLMSVNVAQIRDMYKYYPAIEKMFELEQEKSDSVRDQRREALEGILQAKNLKGNKGQGPTPKQVKPAEAKSGSVYDRINRNKPKQHTQTNGSVANSAVSTSSNNVTADNSSSAAQSHLPPSNRAMKRQRRKQEVAQLKEEARKSVAENSSGMTGVPEVASSTRQASTEPEARDTKRAKLDVQDVPEANEPR